MPHDYRRDGARTVFSVRLLGLSFRLVDRAIWHLDRSWIVGVAVMRFRRDAVDLDIDLGRWRFSVGRGL